MSKTMKANPLGLLQMEVVQTGVPDMSDDYTYRTREQVPVKQGLAAQDTFASDVMKPTSRAPVELRRMHLPGGGSEGVGGDKSKTLAGASLLKELDGKGADADVEKFADYPTK